ncbi:MAG: PHP domain-containing protein [Croceitalea sp.]|nr:PHP domain-containing protein [Croceitalea sp.]MBT8237196.1 PHP domain-containing protein [Croceitalea sp.]NNC34631.1 PHP domain-containing protein [Croceitalea sp.]
MRLYFVLSISLCYLGLNAQDHAHKSTRALSFPDIPGYKTLTTDLHQHTVFSDGEVWPSIRVQEALRDNLDAISLTEHLEYQPHLADIPHPDRNRAYQLALQEAKDHELLIIPGSEITRRPPAGHSNAIFITDANALMVKDSVKQFATAKNQGAFVFWNHPSWYAQSPTGTPILSDFQKARIENGELHGIEVINDGLYEAESFALALDYNLTIMGTSDIHGLIDWQFLEKGQARPVTLVFAKERTVPSIKEALFAGRTVAVYNELFVGRSQYLIPLLKESIQIESASYFKETAILSVMIKNVSSNSLLFENNMKYTFYNSSPVFEVKAGAQKLLQIKTMDKLARIDLKLKALGAYEAPGKHPIITWEINLED